MRVLEQRFLRGPNIYRMTPCFVSVLDLKGYRPVGLDELPDAAALLRTLMPHGFAPVIVDAAEVARMLARLMFSVQAWADSPATYCETVIAAPTAAQRYRLVFGYQHEAVAEGAILISIELVTAILEHQPFDFEARLSGLSALADTCTSGPTTQALLQSARDRGIPVMRLDDNGDCFALGWGVRQQHCPAGPPEPEGLGLTLDDMFAEKHDGRIPVVAITGTNGKSTTTQLIAHVLRDCGMRTGTTTAQGIYIDGRCARSASAA